MDESSQHPDFEFIELEPDVLVIHITCTRLTSRGLSAAAALPQVGDYPLVLIDLRDVEFINSLGFGEFADLVHALRWAGKRVALAPRMKARVEGIMSGVPWREAPIDYFYDTQRAIRELRKRR